MAIGSELAFGLLTGSELAFWLQIGVWAANRNRQRIGVLAANLQRIGFWLQIGSELAFWLQIGVLGCKNWQSAANWRLGCKYPSCVELALWLQIGVWAANWRLDCKLAFWLQIGVLVAIFCSHNAILQPERQRTLILTLTLARTYEVNPCSYD